MGVFVDKAPCTYIERDMRASLDNGSSSMSTTKRARKPLKAAIVRKKAKKAQRERQEGIGPVYVRPADGSPIHPALEAQLRKPFLASIYIDPGTRSLRYPLPNGQQSAILAGLHRRMLHRFFRNQPLDNDRGTKPWPKRMRSSEQEGSRADRALEEAIRTGEAPPPARHTGASAYASAVWEYWRDHGHRPVLAQLPVM